MIKAYTVNTFLILIYNYKQLIITEIQHAICTSIEMFILNKYFIIN